MGRITLKSNALHYHYLGQVMHYHYHYFLVLKQKTKTKTKTKKKKKNVQQFIPGIILYLYLKRLPLCKDCSNKGIDHRRDCAVSIYTQSVEHSSPNKNTVCIITYQGNYMYDTRPLCTHTN